MTTVGAELDSDHLFYGTIGAGAATDGAVMASDGIDLIVGTIGAMEAGTIGAGLAAGTTSVGAVAGEAMVSDTVGAVTTIFGAHQDTTETLVMVLEIEAMPTTVEEEAMPIHVP